MASHLLQEHNSDGLYTDTDSYEPLTQIRDWTDTEDNSQQQTSYFHCDQIGIPREMTDKNGKLLWFGEFVNQDPIGLEGGYNLYWFAFNIQESISPLGLARS